MSAQDSQVEVEVTDRGQVQTRTIGPLEVKYLSGKDAGPDQPVFQMSMGEITLRNTGAAPVNLKYDTMQTFFMGHVFTFGKDAPRVHRHPRMEGHDDSDFVDYDLPPGKTLTLSQQDLLANYQELGRAYFADGHVCTEFAGAVQVDGVSQPLELGPICFDVDMDRDWEREVERHTKWSLDRSGR